MVCTLMVTGLGLQLFHAFLWWWHEYCKHFLSYHSLACMSSHLGYKIQNSIITKEGLMWFCEKVVLKFGWR